MRELPLPWAESELIATVLGRGGGAELHAAAVRLGQLPFWRRRELSAGDLCRDYGLRAATARRLVALWELAERWYPDERPGITTVHDALILFDRLRCAPQERIEVVLLDARHRLISTETVAVGTVNASRVLARDVFAPALRLSAVAVIVGHNHPSGDPTPSASDAMVTQRLRQGADLLGVALLDHIIVAERTHHSFREAERWDQALPAA